MQYGSSDFGYLWMHRLFSLTGIVFAFSYLLLFLLPYSAAFQGEAAFDRVMVILATFPMRGWIEALLVGLPLLVHLVMGLLILQGSHMNVFAYGSYRNWMYSLQRIAGLLLIPCLGYYLYAGRLAIAVKSGYVDYRSLQLLFSAMQAKIIYGIGMLCAGFYIGNGLPMVARSLGIAASRRSREALVIVGWIVTIVLVCWGVAILFALGR